MHAAIERNSWRLPPEDIVQVADPRTKKAPGDMEEELVISEQDEGRNWMSVVLSLLVIGGVISGIVTAIYTLGYVDELLYWSGKRIVLQEALRSELKPWRLKPSWSSSDQFLFHADDGGVSVYSTLNDNVTRLVSNHTITQLNVKWFQASQDLKYVLLRHNVKRVYKNTFLAYYTIYDVRNDHLMPVRLKGVPKVQQSKLRAALWCGNSSRIIVVGEDNNIYFMPSPVDQSADYQITYNGEDGLFYNGVPDWLYQEEIVGEKSSIWCSEDGSMLLFASYNDSLVRSFKYPSLDMSKSVGDFPSTGSLPYPTPGTANPKVELWLVDLNSTDKAHVPIEPPQVFQNKEYYLTSAGWIDHNNEKVVAVWLNRPQNLSIISVCQTPEWKCGESHAERAPENGWVSIKGHPVFSEDGSSFLLMSRIQEGETGRFIHIKQVTLSEEPRISVISHGKYQVTKILAWDYVNNVVYYLGTDGEKAGQRHLYVVKNPKNERAPLSKATPICVTCDHSSHRYDNCSYFNAYLPPPPYTKGISRYIVECLGPGLPLAGVHTWFNHTILIGNLYTTRPKCGPKLYSLALPLQRTFHVPLPHGQGKGTAQLLLPPSWREELRDAAFPVLVEVNGRPGTPLVTNEFSIDWGTYMSSQFDVVYIKLDIIDEGSNTVNMRFVDMQIQDYITVIRYLIDEIKFLDKERIAVWGRGFGGYVTSMILGSQHHIVKCGIAVSPITDWLYYNSAFTERLLGQPSETYKEYVENDAVQRSRHIEAGSLFLIHGLADISVPYVHSMGLAKALTRQGILFRYQSYGDEGHELSGVLEHSYMSMENFLTTCLSLDKNEQVGL